jgi:hypothetical protein
LSLERKREEFYRNVWDHASDPFQLQFDARRALEPDEVAVLRAIAKASIDPDQPTACAHLRGALADSDNGIELVLQLVGLTRSKILNDLRAAAESTRSGLRVPSSHKRLTQAGVWDVAGPYLIARTRSVLGPIASEPEDAFGNAVEALNQATWPGYIRQERAKRSGHEAEARVATLLRTVGIPFVPEEKADNPLVPDIQLGGVSFDIVVPGRHTPTLVVKSTVHTSNIGQFGESKDALEMSEAKGWIEGLNADSRPILFAFIDGIGFRSNRAGLDGVLSDSDEFCQFKTIWKIGAAAAAVSGTEMTVYLPAETIDEHAEFIGRWDHAVVFQELHAAQSTVDLTPAGIGFLRAAE